MKSRSLTVKKELGVSTGRISGNVEYLCIQRSVRQHAFLAGECKFSSDRVKGFDPAGYRIFSHDGIHLERLLPYHPAIGRLESLIRVHRFYHLVEFYKALAGVQEVRLAELCPVKEHGGGRFHVKAVDDDRFRLYINAFHKAGQVINIPFLYIRDTDGIEPDGVFHEPDPARCVLCFISSECLYIEIPVQGGYLQFVIKHLKRYRLTVKEYRRSGRLDFGAVDNQRPRRGIYGRQVAGNAVGSDSPAGEVERPVDQLPSFLGKTDVLARQETLHAFDFTHGIQGRAVKRQSDSGP